MSVKKKISCLYCGATNNFPMDSSGKKILCGKCRNPLPIPGEIAEPEESQVHILLQKSRLPLLVDFYSPSCAPCLMMDPILEGLARRRAGELMVVKINADNLQSLAAGFGVQSVPAFVIIYQGNERGRMTGAMPEADFSLWVASRI